MLHNFAFRFYKQQALMVQIDDIYKKLQTAVEKAVSRQMCTPRDFDYLSARIYDVTGENLSAMTLKRFWGYLGEKNKRQLRLNTLNLLARMVGYTDWATYYKESSVRGEIESDFLKNNSLITNSLQKGTMVQLMWHPDRVVTIRHDGYEVFSVVESVNSKLSAGDTFRCGLIVEGEPLYLSQLIHEAGEPMSYVCGSEGGVKFRVL
jgi:hypothetical protein